MATHSSILACRIPWTEEPGRRDIYIYPSIYMEGDIYRERDIYIERERGIYIFLSLYIYIYALPSLLRCKCSADEC